MQDSITKPTEGETGQPFSPDAIEATMRARVRDIIETIVQEELDAVLGAAKSARVGETRHGHRHGARARTLILGMSRSAFASEGSPESQWSCSGRRNNRAAASANRFQPRWL
jgi:hypothetical protein